MGMLQLAPHLCSWGRRCLFYLSQHCGDHPPPTPWLGLSGVFNFQSCAHWVSSNLSTTVQFPYPGTASHDGPAPGSLLPWTMTPVPASLSLQCWGQQFAICLSFSHDPGRIADFAGFLAFYLLLGWNGDFQACYMQNWKREVLLLNPSMLTFSVHGSRLKGDEFKLKVNIFLWLKVCQGSYLWMMERGQWKLLAKWSFWVSM